MTVFDTTLTDGIGAASTLEQLRRTSFPLLADSLFGGDVFEVLRLIPVLETQGLGIELADISYYGPVIVERLRLLETLLPNHKAQMSLADTMRFSEALFRAAPAALTDGVGMALTQEMMSAIAVMERLGVGGLLGGAAIYNMTLTQGLRLADSLRQFFGADIEDGIEIDTSMVVRQLAAAGWTDTVGIEAALNPLFVLRVVATDGIGLDDVDAVRMLFSPTLVDGVEISAGFLKPDGSLTTWVMNARTGAVSEYQNYEFNSFAQLGGRYIGASASGLYELLGDTDDGGSIVARLKGGFMQFGGTHLSRLSAAYIATRGEGDFVLRIVTGEGETYNYAASTRNMRSTKVHMGKGQRARYFAFELISAGQDFDLDTLEFVPIVVQRRV